MSIHFFCAIVSPLLGIDIVVPLLVIAIITILISLLRGLPIVPKGSTNSSSQLTNNPTFALKFL